MLSHSDLVARAHRLRAQHCSGAHDVRGGAERPRAERLRARSVTPPSWLVHRTTARLETRAARLRASSEPPQKGRSAASMRQHKPKPRRHFPHAVRVRGASILPLMWRLHARITEYQGTKVPATL
eukprot:2958371-Pleurochrysis_carterae.AAC.1